MSGDVPHLVHLGDHAVGVDQVRDTLGEVRIRLALPSLDAVRTPDGTVDVAQQREVEALLLRELEVLRGGVEARAEDLGAGLGELWASVTEALPFTRSARRRGFGEPPQHDPRTAKVREVHRVAGLIREREVRRSVSDSDHQLATSMRPAHVAYSAA